jgi:hypothetical protein
MRATRRKGDIATSRAVARVRCKYVSGKQVDLRRIHSNAQGYVVKRTAAGAYDWLYVLDAADHEYLLRECFAGRRSVNLRELTSSERWQSQADCSCLESSRARKGPGGSNPSRSATRALR